MKKTTVADCVRLAIPKIEDPRGNLSVIEKMTIPFEMKRVYYLYDVPSGAVRGGHAHLEQQSFLVALSGSFEIVLQDGTTEKTVFLNKPNEGLLIREGIWREINNFSSGSVCLSISSDYYDASDYIRDYELFLELKK